MDTHLRRNVVALVIALVCCAAPAVSFGMGMEDFGDLPFSPLNYREWPGIMPLVEREDLVYHIWVNGNEDFYYSGDIAAFNDALQKFAEVQQDVHEVILRPGPGVVKDIMQKRSTTFTWCMNIRGGLAGIRDRSDKGDLVWNRYPTLSLYVTEDMPLDKIVIPWGVTLVELSDVGRRVREGLTSTDQTVRGWGAGVLARLNPYDEDNMKAIIHLLDDEVVWVRLNAVGALATYGSKARAGADALQRCLTSNNADLQKRARQTLDQIESAADATADEEQFLRSLERIKQYRELQTNFIDRPVSGRGGVKAHGENRLIPARILQ